MKFIKALLLTVVILGAIGSSVAQKKSTLMGDIVIGELAARDEATREVTIKYPGKERRKRRLTWSVEIRRA